jgi:AAA+ ATPase superfamily predicted ATPase
MSMKKYPFKFLDSYNREDRGIFFGRDEEINALYEMIFQSSVVLVYGASGTGKTSLINCGLAGKFEPHDWLALMIRRGNNINDSLEKALKDAGGTFTSSTVEINWKDDFSGDASSKPPALSPVGNAIKSVYQKSFRPVYLIFDQFEELFILGSKAEQELFLKTVQDILQSEQPVKLIFSIREEYLG